MSMTLKELVVTLGFDVDSSPLERLDERLNGLKEGFLHLTELIIGEEGSLFAFVETASKAAVQLKNTAESVGMTTQSLQKLQYAAQKSGLDVQKMTTALQILSTHAEQASMGGEASVMLFNRLGISVNTASGHLKPANQLLMEMAAAWKHVDESMKPALARELLGRGGAQLIPLLNKGPEEIIARGQEAQRLGIVLTDEQVEKSEQLHLSLIAVESRLTGLRNVLSYDVMPAFSDTITQIIAWYDANKKLIDEQLLSFLREVINESKVFVGVIFGAAKFAYDLAQALGGIDKALRLVTSAMIAWQALKAVNFIREMVMEVKWLTAAFDALGIAEDFALGPLGIVVGLVTALGLGAITYGVMGNMSSGNVQGEGGSGSVKPTPPPAWSTGAPAQGSGNSHNTIFAPVTINPHTDASPEEIGRVAAEHITRVVRGAAAGTAAGVEY